MHSIRVLDALRPWRRVLLVLIPLVLAGAIGSCKARPLAGATVKSADEAGQQSATPNMTVAGNRYASPPTDQFLAEVQPILAKRCVACHACNEAPCQLKMEAFKGLDRGLTSVNPYASHLASDFAQILKFEAKNKRGITPTAALDQYSTQTFQQQLGFNPIINADNPDNSILLKALVAGDTNVKSNGFNFPALAALKHGEKESWQCPASPQAYDTAVAKYPLLGMPFGLPKLKPEEFSTLVKWVKDGAHGPSAEAMAALSQPQQSPITQGDPNDAVNAWEKFFYSGTEEVGYGTHVDLVGRYFYEHVFLAHLHFAENPGEFFELVRSRTPPGKPLDEIFTERPYDAPGISSRVYFRLKKISGIIPRKTHIVLELSLKELDVYKKMFYPPGNNWWKSVTRDPGYADWSPFVRFKQIPAEIRYRYILRNTKLMIDHMSRGPVCVGSMATYVVADHFWAWFLDPSVDPAVQDPNFDFSGLETKTDKENHRYRLGWEKSLRAVLRAQGKTGLSINDLWNGDKDTDHPSPSAWTTQVRHETNQTVHTGPQGGFPQSIWIGSFTMMERLFYNLVVSFRAYGDAGHKLETWQYQTHVRNEGEDLFISMLPEPSRRAIRDQYTQGTLGKSKQWLDYELTPTYIGRPAGDTDPNVTPQSFALKVQEYLGPNIVLDPTDLRNDWPPNPAPAQLPDTVATPEQMEAGFRVLRLTPKGWGQIFPNITYVRIGDGDQYSLFTIIANRGYKSHAIEFAEALQRLPGEDTISIYKGLYGNYPNLFLDIPLGEAQKAFADLSSIAVGDAAAFSAFKVRYEVRQNNGNGRDFWAFVDWLNSWQEKNDPINAGIVDLREYGYEGK